MVIAIVLGLIYAATVVLNFIKREWPTRIKRILTIGHIVFGGLTVIQIILLLTNQMTFRGIYSDRIIFWGLFITGGLLFSLFKRSIWAKIYFGIYLYYPIIALTTFFMDRIMFVIVASPILASVMVPDTYYKDNTLEIRSNIGLMVPRKIVLVEKNLVTEKEIGMTEYGNDKIDSIEILNSTADYVNARLNHGAESELVTFKTSR
jgi:hypothetical protein